MIKEIDCNSNHSILFYLSSTLYLNNRFIFTDDGSIKKSEANHVLRGASSCLGFESGVRDFRRGTGTRNMVVVFTSMVQLARFLIFISPKIFI